MKRFLQLRNILNKKSGTVFFMLFFLFSASSLFAQAIVVNRTVTENPTLCNQYDVELEVTGNPSVAPSEVVLVIDRSGSMDDGPKPEPIDYAKDAAIDFVNNFFANNPTGMNRIAVVSYAASASTDIGLTGSSGKQDVIDAINGLVTNGNTNIEAAMVKADQVLSNQATFDCNTNRSIVLLTDGVANRDNHGNSCSNSGVDTPCQLNAIQAGINAQTTTKGGEVYNQNIFSVGLFNAIQGGQQTAATKTIDGIQNAGLFTTENAPDLMNIYNTILGQLTPAATQISGQALVTNTIDSGFDYVSGSISASKGTASASGDLLSWYVNHVSNETITLNYSIVSVGSDACGIEQNTGEAVMQYIDADCNEQTLTFNNPDICVPCPEVTAEIEQNVCDNSVAYDADVYSGECSPVSGDVEWEFFLNNVSVGTSNTASGTFTYTGSEDFEGNFRAEVSYSGSYGTGCTLPAVDDEEEITLISQLTASVEKTDPTEAGQCSNGSATVDPSNGTAPYTYQWSANAGSQTTQTATNLGAGTYDVTITDANGCSVEKSIVLTCDIEGWNFECGSNKVVDEYGYNANGNTTTTATIPDAGNVYQYVVEIVYKGNNPGQTVEVVDNANVSHTLSRSVPMGSSSNIWVYRGLVSGSASTVTYTNPNVKNKLQSLVVYAFRNVPDATANSGKFTDLSGVNDIQSFTIDIPAFSSPRDLVVETPISELTNDGRYLLLKAEAGGVKDQVFLYGSDPSLPGGTCCLSIPTLTLEDVPGNVTQVTITVDTRNKQNGQNVNGQSWIIAGGVNVDANCYEDLELTLDNKTDVQCFGENSGSITVQATGGLEPYEYSLNGGTSQSSPTFNNLTAGVYTIEVTDSLGNTDSISVTLTEPEALSVQITKENASATGGCENGQATADPSGGTPPYSYQWSASANNQTTATATNLPSGTHTVTITDANDCEIEQGVVIDCVNDCDAVITVDYVKNVPCTGENGGMAKVSASSAANPSATFTFTWNTVPPQVDSGATSSTISNQPAGVYTVSVTIDGTQCQPVEQSVTITEPANALNVSATSTDESGPTTGDGTATANPSGGTPPYSYSWSPGGETTQTITGLSAGTYTVTVTDANGCTATASTTVNPGTCQGLSATASSTPVTCNGDNDGTATVAVSGGSGSFTYAWSPGGETTQTITGLSAGTYSVIVTDTVTQCTAEATTTVNEPNMLSSGIAVTNISCFGGDNGSLDLTVTGGTQPYSFEWSNGATTEDLSNLTAGTYSVTITDVNGCTTTDSAEVLQPSEALSLEIVSQTDIVCNELGAVTVEAFGGTSPYLYSIDGGTPQASGTFDSLEEGDYTISVADANGCDAEISVTILSNCIQAIDDINDTFVNLPVNGDVSTNDLNLDGPVGTETFTLVSGPSNGTLTLNPDGTYTYTPATDYVGEDSFEYQVCDTGNPVACDTATVYIEVQPIGSPDNDPPVANADTNSTQEGTSVDGTVLPNDFDPDGDPITVTGNTLPTNGTVTINPDGTYTYSPNPGFTGEDTFEYTICDNGSPALCDTATVTIQVVDGTDNMTTAVDDAYYGFPDTDITGNVLNNDTDPESDGQNVDTTVSPSNGPSNGTVVLNADGTFTYTPNTGYTGTDSFVYEIYDNGSPEARDIATVYISIDPNDGGNEILAIDDINNTFMNLPVSGNVSTNDLNPDGPVGTETFTLVEGPAYGSLSFNPDGTYIYYPENDYVGEDTFKYQVCDSGNPVACDTATVYIEIQPEGSPDNAPPVANADTNSTQEGTPVDGTVLSNDFDPDGDPITVTGNTPPTNGTVTINPDGTYTYSPNPGFTGEDTFEYTICDNGSPALCDTATVTIQVVDGTENMTTAVDDAYYGFPSEDIVGNVLDNDTDPEGDNQTVDTLLSPRYGPVHGSLVLNADGTFVYTPFGSYTGTDSFVYEIYDNGSPEARDIATVYISIDPNDGGNVILAIDDINDTFVNLPVSGDVSTNDINPDGPSDTETFTLVNGPSNGSLTLNLDGTYTYTPATDYVGEDTFEYQVCDGGNPVACDTATVYIEVQPVGSPDNDPPVANADTNTTKIDVPVNGNVLPNDYDPDGDPITVTGNTTPANGTVTINPDGTYTYTPNPGFTGEDTFEYTICDNGNPALCDTAVVTIQVIACDCNSTVANDDAYYGLPDQDILGNVLDNDTDPEGHNQNVDTAITPISGPTNGTLSINADGSFTYTPNAGYIGTDQFVYGVEDDGFPVATDVATVYISIDPNDGGNEILAIDDINDTFVNLPVNGDVSTNDLNPDGPTGTETFTLVSGPSNGSLTFNPDGTYTYTPATDYVGEDTFEYQVCDAGNPVACDTATVTIEIVDDPILENDPPVANNDTNTTEVDVPVSGTVISNDFDPDGDPITVTNNTAPANGAVTVNPDGTYTYTPNPGFVGEDTFEYTICDNGSPALCDTATVTIYIVENNANITVANDDAYYGEINAIVSGNVLDNDNDPEGDNQSVDIAISPVSGPSNGTVTINADGSFEYTPNTDFTGNDQFVYGIVDDGSPIATDLATVYILIEETPAPAIAIVKTGGFNDEDQDGCTNVGETITYTFTVTNQGNVPLTDIAVTDPLLEAPNPVVPIVLVSGDDGDGILQETETWVYEANYTLTQEDIDTGEVVNQATVHGTDPDGTTVEDLSGTTTTTDDETTTTLCQEPAIAIVKTGDYNDGGDCSQPGEEINYTFTVTNEGNVSLSSVNVTDPLIATITGPTGDTDGDGELDVDETWEYTGSYVITQDDIDAGEVNNQATAEGTAPDGTPVEDLSGTTTTTDDETTTTLCQEPAIAIVKTSSYDDGGDCSQPGEEINYTFTVTNEGNVSLSSVNVTDPLIATINGPTGDTDGDGELDVDETWEYTGSYVITQADIDAGEVINQATAEGTAPDGTTVEDLSGSMTTTDDETTTTLCQEPAITIVKTSSYDDGGDCSQPGEEINYTFTVTNEGNVSLSNVNVTDPLIATINGPTGDTDGDGELDVDETWEYTGSYVITQDDIDAGEVINQATAEGTAPDGTTVEDLSGTTTTTDDETTTTLCQAPAIAIVKTSSYDDGGDCSQPGEEINYTFTVTNEGNVSLSSVNVTDPLIATISGPTGDTDGDGELDVTEEWEYTGTYVITQADIDNGSVTNTATAEGTAPDGTVVTDDSGSTVDNDDPTETELCQTPAIAIVKASSYDDGGDCSQPGEEINYTFTVTNEGNVSLENVSVTDPLIATISGPTGDTDGDGELDVTEEWEYTGTYVITQADIDNGSVTNTATAEGTAPDGTVVTDDSGSTVDNDDPTETELCQTPAIAIVKTSSYDDGGDCSQPGEEINYTFTVTNEGNVSLSNVNVTDPLIATINGPTGDTDGDGELDVDETWEYTGSYVITQDDIDKGEVINQATAEGTAPDGAVVTDESGLTINDDDPTITTLCQDPVIAIVKTGVFNDEDGDGCSNVGETISYTFSVTNEGNVSLSFISIQDPLLGGTLTGPDSGDTDGDDKLDISEEWIYTATYTITQADINAGEVVNQATAKGEAPSGETVTDDSGATIGDDDPTVTVLCQNAAIAIVKTGVFNDENGDDCSDVGETIGYTFSVTNQGNVSLTSINVTDPLLGGAIAGPDSGDANGNGELDLDEEWVYSGSYAITQADINAGEVVNQATAEGVDPNGNVVSDDSGTTINDDDPTVTVLCQNGGIALVKIGTFSDENGDGCTQVGETIVYDFIVTNTGIVDLTNVTVTDPLVTVNGGPINLVSGATDATTFTATYTITQADIDAGQVVNQATAEGTTPEGDVVSDVSGATINDDDPTVTILCQDPSMSLEKVGVFNDENSDGIPQEGETISYAFSVTNTGNVTLYNITIEDPLPGIEIQGGPIASLAPDETDDTTFTAIYSINDADIEAGQVINQATVIGEDEQGTSVTDESDDPNNDEDVDNNGDGEPDDPTVTVLPNVDPEGDFEIFNGITPNGDNLNDYFIISGIQDYPDNNVKIYNRWGVLVWETNGYGGSNGKENVFEGESNGRATIRANEELPTGTYFYILSFPGDNPGKASYSGYLYINR
ncbi:DUF7507 domain-containing protein [Marixanthomonas spongiae]|uniref:VWFA domain-containing protein n=1 Tax=Marixanthomonas spongiae TaxID=2174845 RepID=A0A2U0I5E9_9FLAO|nr:Ig-like domain-containing protein [Marixanthomonas spongiae]PVW16333.1 hypothetical protein DDV96_03480 [Marixanthomonas spongiae]